jgi:hypothetical protein
MTSLAWWLRRGRGGLKFLWKIKVKKIKNYKLFEKKNKKRKTKKDFLIFFPLKHFNPPAPTEEPSCMTAPPWGWGDWNATEPPANVRGGGGLKTFWEKKTYIYFYFYFF